MKKLIDYYKSLSAPVKASIFFVICNILQRAISLITTPIFTRLLTTEQYGLFSVYNSYYTIISILATFNLTYGVYIRGLVKFEDDVKRFTSAMLGLSGTITSCLLIIYLIGAEFWNKLLGLNTLLMLVMFIECFFTVAYSFWITLQRNKYRYKSAVAVTVLMYILSPIIGIMVVLQSEHKAEARIISHVMVQVCIGFVFYVLIMIRGKQPFSKKYWKYGIKFNLPLIPHYLSMTVLQQADRIMISRMVGNREAAIYSIAYTVSTLMLLVTQAINHSFTPFTYQSIREGNYCNIGKIANVLLIIVGLGCILVMAFGPEVIGIMAPAEYHEAIWIIPPVAASAYFMFLYPLFGNIEFYYEKTKFTMLASCFGAVANIVLNWIFIKIFGYLAAGYTTLACYILFAIGHYAAYKTILKKSDDINQVYDIRSMVIISASVLIAMVGVLFIYKNVVIRYSIIVLILVILVIKRKNIIYQLKILKNKK